MLNLRLALALCVLTTGTALIHHPVLAAEDGASPNTPFTQHIVKDDFGRNVTYYLSRPRSGPAPLLLMIQGSGCTPLFNHQPGPVSSNLFNLFRFAGEGRFTVMAVEKPFASEKRPASGAANTCSADFNNDFTAERWLYALQASLKEARKSGAVDQKRSVVLGTSEGAVMATMLAAKDDRITDVIAISGSGTTQLYDFFVHA